jgi:hypothetical protein
VALAGLTVNLFTLYSKGFSPQFIVQLVPFAVLLLPSLRGISYLILLDVINFLEATVYFIMLPDERWLLVTTVVLRTLLFLALSFEYGFILFRVKSLRVTALHRRASIALLACVAATLCALVYPLGRAYFSPRRQAEVDSPVGVSIRTQSSPGDAAASGSTSQDLVISCLTIRTDATSWARTWQSVLNAAPTSARHDAMGPEPHLLTPEEPSRYDARQD